MRLRRSLTLFAFVLGLTVLAGETTTASPQDKKDKKAMRLALKAKLAEEAKKAEEAAKAEGAKKAAESAKAAAAVKPLPVVPAVVPMKDTAALSKMIDSHIDAKLTAGKVAASPVCSDEEFLRRAYLDITGVIPTTDKAKAFLDDTSADKRAKLIEELLASPNFGRRLADLWQAKLLPRESGNRFVLRDPFVKWLEGKFNENTPWDKFATDLVTATGTVEDNPAVTYFLANRAVDKLTDGVTQHFLGIQLACAQCHNHPFTGWKQTEYWGMATFFSKVRPDNPKNANKGGDNTKIGVQEGNVKTKAKDFFPESAKTVPAKFLGGDEPRLTNNEPYRPVLAKWLTAYENPYFAKAMVNRTWALMFGTGFVNPIDDMMPENLPSHPELLNELAAQFAAGGFDVKNLYRAIANSRAYQRTSKPFGGNHTDDQLFSHMTVKTLTPEQLYDSLNLVTASGEKVAPSPRPAGGKKGPAGGRDGFVQFFLGGAETSNPTEYEAGIPQVLRLMNSRITGNPNVVKSFVTTGDKPATVIEKLYLATLSRRPTTAESEKLAAFVAKSATAQEAYGDILWAILNSSEFTMVK
jgi:hypothetical protein